MTRDVHGPRKPNRNPAQQSDANTQAQSGTQPAGMSATRTILMLQRHAGNQAVMRLLNRTTAQGKEPVQPIRSSSHAIQRVEMPNADQIANTVGEVPETLRDAWIGLLSASQRYHQYIDQYRQAQRGLGLLDPALVYEWREGLNSKKGALRTYAQTLATEARAESSRLEKKLVQTSGTKTAIETLRRVIQITGQIVGLADQPAIALSELRSTHNELIAEFKQINQQNVDTFLANNAGMTLTDANLAPGSVQSNVNAGAVNKVGLATYNPTPGGGPISTPLTGYTKTGVNEDGDEVVSDPGFGIGISPQDPRAALRAVATYQLSELIGLGIIPRTVLTQYTNEEGKQRLGQVMEKAVGSTGQGKAGDIRKRVTDHARKAELLRYINILRQPNPHPQALKRAKDEIVGKFVEINGDLYEVAKDAVYNFDWSNPVLQRDLSTLQIFDLIVGHVDRHAGNYIVDYDPQNKNNVYGVKGIDNDDTFGSKYINVQNMTRGGQGIEPPGTAMANKLISKTPGLPPVLDVETALRLLATSWSDIAAELATYTISPAEIAATKLRWDQVIAHVITLVQNNSLASMGNVPPLKLMQLAQTLQRKHGVAWNYNAANVMQWGAATMALQNQSNSYAAEQQSRVNFYQNPANPEHVIISEPQYKR
jgi:hypothetical protein